MPIEYKLVILLVAVGLSNLILRNNRNWIFGYRTNRSLRSHATFAYANRIFGLGMIIIGSLYFLWLWFVEGSVVMTTFWQHVLFLTAYFILLLFFIETRLGRR